MMSDTHLLVRHPRLRSLGVLLLLAVVIALLPFVGVSLHDALSEREHYIEMRTSSCQALSRHAAAVLGRYVQGTLQSLQLLSRAAVTEGVTDRQLYQLFDDTRARQKEIANISLINGDGSFRLSAMPVQGTPSTEHRVWFRRVQQFRTPALGEFQVGFVSGVPSINLAVPLPDSVPEKPASIMQAGLRLTVLDAILDDMSLEEGQCMVLLDRAGTVLASRGLGNLEIGRPFRPDHPGSFVQGGEFLDHDGVPRSYAFTRVPNSDNGLWVGAGMNLRLIGDQGRHLFWNLFYELLATFVAALLAVGWITRNAVLRPVRRMIETARSITKGDWTARARIGSGSLELLELGATFDTLVSVVGRQIDDIRQEELLGRRTNSRLQTELEATNQRLLEMVIVRQSADAALRRSEAVSRTFIEGIPESAIMTRTDGTVIMANAVFAERIHRTLGDIIGKRILEVLPETTRELHRNALEHAVGTGTPRTFELNSGERQVHVSYTPILDTNREVLAVAILGFDVTTRHQIESQLRNTVAQLEAALSDVRQLSGMLPICASCKKIRDDKGYWNQLEQFLSTRSDIRFSHGICPDCIRRLYPDLDDEPGV